MQSTALFLLAREPGSTLRLDLAVFADTGEEPASVYAHLRERERGSQTASVRTAARLIVISIVILLMTPRT